MDLPETVRVRLEPEADIIFALLFGSVARGEQGPNSDVDVGVYVDERLGAWERFDLRLSVAAALEELGQPDVIVLNDAPPLLAHRALQGKPVLTRDKGAYVRFFVRTLALAEDERYFRSIFARARRDRVREGRFGRP